MFIRGSFAVAVVVMFVLALLSLCENEWLLGLLLFFGVTFLIVAVAALQIDSYARKEPPTFPLFCLFLTYLLWWWADPEVADPYASFVVYPGLFLAVSALGGFFSGLLASPLIARWRGVADPGVDQRARFGVSQISRAGWWPVIFVMAAAVVFTLAFSGYFLFQGIRLLQPAVQVCMWAGLALLISLTAGLTYRSSIWGKPQKFGFERQAILDRYFGFDKNRRQ